MTVDIKGQNGEKVNVTSAVASEGKVTVWSEGTSINYMTPPGLGMVSITTQKPDDMPDESLRKEVWISYPIYHQSSVTEELDLVL